MYVLNSLIPVFLLIALGKALTRASFFSADLGRSLNLLTYWIALPALLIDKITQAAISSAEVSRISLLLILATLVSIPIGYLAATVLKVERRALGAFVQGSVRANNAFIGLPVILYALSDLYPGVEASATLALAPAIIFYNIFSVSILLVHSDREKQNLSAARLFVRQILTNPLLLACFFGIAFNALGLHFPIAIERSLTALGNTALALALLSIGSSLSFKGIGHGLSRSLTASTIQVFIQPLIGLIFALLWGLPAMERQILLIYLACPAAVATYVMADIFGSDRDLAAHIIVVSTLLSAISLSLVIALGG